MTFPLIQAGRAGNILILTGLTLPLAIVAICHEKCRVATNICHWLKEQKLLICEKEYFDQLLDFQILFLLFLHTLLLSHILLFGCWIFSIPSECQTVWIQIRPDILSGLIWVLTVFKSYQQTTKCLTGSGFKLFAKVISKQQKWAKGLNTKKNLMIILSG